MCKCKRVLQALGVVATTVLVYAHANAISVIETSYNVYTNKLDKEYKVLYISDIHYGHVQPKNVLKDNLNKLKAVNADIVIIGGDVAMEGVTKEDMEDAFKMLGSIPSKYGTYFVYGNHDIPKQGLDFHYTKEELDSAIQDNGIKILCEDSCIVDNKVLLIGRDTTDDCTMHKSTVTTLVDQKDIDEHYTICLNHVPVDMHYNSLFGVDLQLSGHTHGGQVFPINLEAARRGYVVYGEQDFGKMKLFVSSGMGVDKVPFRTQHHCEYVVINIKGIKEVEE